METVSASDSVLNANYNHDGGDIVGVGENIRVENGEFVCDVFIEPFRPYDRAEEIVQRSKNGTKYGTSIEFTPAEADVEELADGEVAVVNGIEVECPAYIYRNVVINAYAVEPNPCDRGTALTLLKQKNLMTKTIAPKTVVAKAKLSSETSADSGDE